ncbi:MAG TPA: PilZ domain-containing protein [Sandaracinaceae bacterium LLY-WYZ-13_1]|nr:PilZ domain-containing protein [Sandaracinaceae bacterium LLY-WYZ-13_1]
MLQPVEILPGCRRALRRAVSLEATVASDAWDAPRLHRTTDLSPQGMRLAAGTRLPVGSTVSVSFSPPGWWVLGPVELAARVVRSEPRDGDRPAAMGLAFQDLRPGLEEQLAHTLIGRPPPLPQRGRSLARELVWVDALLTYTEDLGDRVNTIEVSERLAAGELEELAFEPLGELMTGGREPYAGRGAASRAVTRARRRPGGRRWCGRAGRSARAARGSGRRSARPSRG